MKFLVYYEIEGEVKEPVIETAVQIFNTMDMDDCYDIHINRIYLLTNKTAPIKCKFFGAWTYDRNWMKIQNAKTEKIYAEMKGSDH